MSFLCSPFFPFFYFLLTVTEASVSDPSSLCTSTHTHAQEACAEDDVSIASAEESESDHVAVSMLQVGLGLKHTQVTRIGSAAASTMADQVANPHLLDSKGDSWPSMGVVAIELLLLGLYLLPWSRIRAEFSSAQRCETENSYETALTPRLAMTDGSEPRLFHHRISMTAKSRPDSLALIDGEHRESFGELHLSTLYVARHLVEDRGVIPSSCTPIGVCAEGRCMMHALLGILHTGNPYVPLPSVLPVVQRDFILADAKIEVVLADSRALAPGGPWEGRSETSPANVLTSSLTSLEAWKPSWEVQEDDLACILYTSGSTGQPKGVMCAHSAYHSRMAWMHGFYPLSEDEVGIQKTAINWVDSLQELFGYLQGGVPLVLAPPEARKNAVALVALCRQHSVSRLVLVPSLLRVFVDAFGANFANELPCLRYYIVSGEAFSSELLRGFLQVAPTGSTVMNLYGSTESSGDVTWAAYTTKSPLVDVPIVPIGRAIPPNKVLLLDPVSLQPVAIGQRGEIFVEGPHVTSGYLNRPEQNDAQFMELPGLGIKRAFRTGDFGKFDEAMQIHFLGREDQQIKVHGQRVDVLHVEFALNEALLALSKEEGTVKLSCAVMAVPSTRYPGSYRLLGFVETTARIDDAKLRQHMLDFVLPAHIPEAFVALQALPRLINGKLDRVAVKQAAIKLAGVEETSIVEERDSFGVLRKILTEHIDARRVVGTMCTIGLFVVIFGHWTPLTRIAWVVQSTSALRLISDDTLLMVGIGALHGMGDQSKFDFSAYEPCFLVCWLVVHFMHVARHSAMLDTVWFLPVLLLSRIWVILWHKLLRTFGRDDTAITNMISILTAAGLAMFEIDPFSLLRGRKQHADMDAGPYADFGMVLYDGFDAYMYLYLFGFYVAPSVVKFSSAKLRSTSGCVLSFSVFILLLFGARSLCVVLTGNGPYNPGKHNSEWNAFGSPFYWWHWFSDTANGYLKTSHLVRRWTMLGVAMVLNVLHVCSAIAFCSALPERVNLTIPGPAMLIMFATNTFFIQSLNVGFTLFGVKVFPSMPDVLAGSGTHFGTMLGGALQLIVMNMYVIGFMASITMNYTFIAGSRSALFSYWQRFQQWRGGLQLEK